MKTKTSVVAAALVAIGCMFAVGCSSKKKNGGTKALSDHKVDTKLLSLFPNGTELVVGVNKSVRKGKLFNKVKGFLKKRLGSKVPVLQLCNIDIVESGDEVVGGGRMGFRDVLLVVRGFKRADLDKCADAAKAKGKTVTVKQDGRFTALVTDTTTHWVGWVDDNTFIAGPDFGKARLQKRIAGENGLDKDTRTVNLLKKVDGNADIWWAGVSPAGKPWKSPVGNFSHTFGTVGLASGIKIDASVGTNSADTAKGLSSMAAGQLSSPPEAIKSIVKKGIKIGQDDKDVRLSVDLSNADIDKIAETVEEDKTLQTVVGMAKRALNL